VVKVSSKYIIITVNPKNMA